MHLSTFTGFGIFEVLCSYVDVYPQVSQDHVAFNSHINEGYMFKHEDVIHVEYVLC